MFMDRRTDGRIEDGRTPESLVFYELMGELKIQSNYMIGYFCRSVYAEGALWIP